MLVKFSSFADMEYDFLQMKGWKEKCLLPYLSVQTFKIIIKWKKSCFDTETIADWSK